jgi:hypothetical protein
MRNKFTLNEGEVQRILGLHKQAILKENKIILSEGNENTLYKNTNYKTKKEQRFAKESDIADAIVIDPGVTFYKYGTDKAVAYNVPIKVKVKGGYTAGKASSTQNITFYCAKGKYRFSGKNKGVFYYSQTGISAALVKNICQKEGVLPNGKKVDGTSNYNSKKNTKDKSNKDTKDKSNNNTKVKGNKYTFDFDAIMKAINDTGKCAGSWGSSDGTNGTSGTQGTSGTNVIQNPLPINNKISAELYYKITAP